MKKLIFLLMCFTLSYYASAQSDTLMLAKDSLSIQQDSDTIVLKISKQDSLLNELLAYSITFMAVPYRYAGRSRAGFDCSGFIFTMYQHIGVILSTDARALFGFGRLVPDSALQAGDIMFYKGTSRYRGPNEISHVALVYEVFENDVKFIHAAVNGGIRFDYLSNAYYTRYYYKTRRMPIFDIEKSED